LDNGAEEALIMPTADDAKVLRDLIHDAEALYWDLEKKGDDLRQDSLRGNCYSVARSARSART